MDEKKDWTISMPEEIRDKIIAEAGHEALAMIMAEIQTTLVSGGMEAMLARSREVHCIHGSPEDQACIVCGALVTQEPGWPDEYECKATPECQRNAYILESTLHRD